MEPCVFRWAATRAVGALLAGLALLAPPTALAQGTAQDQALTLYRRAADRYGAGEFETAAVLLREAIRLHDAAAFHHNLGRALEELGRWQEAQEQYRVFLEREPESSERVRVEARIRSMQERIDEAQEAVVAPPSEVVEQPDPEAEPTRPSGPSTEPAPYITLGASAVPFALGVVFAVLFEDEVAAAREAPDQQQTYSHIRTAESLSAASGVFFVAGALLAASGVVWAVIDLSTSPDEGRAGLQLRLGPSGGALAAAF